MGIRLNLLDIREKCWNQIDTVEASHNIRVVFLSFPLVSDLFMLDCPFFFHFVSVSVFSFSFLLYTLVDRTLKK